VAFVLNPESQPFDLHKKYLRIPLDIANKQDLDQNTHSFRRTALTRMSNAGVPLRHIQEISGHKDLATLQKYLEVSPEHRKSAIAALVF